MEVIETTGPSEVASFAEGRIMLIGYRVGAESHLASKKVAEVSGNGDGPPKFLLATLVRDGKLIEPTPETVLQREDYLYLIATEEHMPDLNAMLHVETIKSRTAVIYGDNYLSQLLATSMLNRHFRVTMLASTAEKAHFLKTYFQNRRDFQVEIGEGTELSLLRRVKVPTTSVFIAAKSDDASNLAACFVAKNLGVGKSVATIKRNDILQLCA